MKKTISVLLITLMLLSMFSYNTFAEESEHILFEDDFSKEAVAWNLQGSKWKDGHVELHTTGWQVARLVDEDFMFYSPYTAEFDVAIKGGVDSTSDWFAFRMGNIMVFFRLSTGTVHGTPGTGETKIGNAPLEVGKNYRIKAIAGENYIAVYYKEVGEDSYRDIGVYANNNMFPSPFEFVSVQINCDVDNVVFTSNGGNVVPDKKVRYLEVGQKDKVTLTGSKATGCTFESLKPDSVTVESDGTIEAKKSGGSKINIKDVNGNIVECAYVSVTQSPATLSFNFDPLKTAAVGKNSNLYDKEKIIICENDICDLRVTIPSDATMKSINWSVEPAGIVDLWGTYPTSPTRTVTGLKAGECVVTAKSAFSAAEAKITIKVLPESEREVTKSETYNFFVTGKKHQLNKGLVGAHVAGTSIADLKEDKVTPFGTPELIKDIGLHSIRSSTGFVTDGMYDPSKGENLASTMYKIPNQIGIPLVCCIGTHMVNGPDSYEQDIANIVQFLKDTKAVYNGQLYIELFNETYSIAFQKQFPTCDHYVNFLKELVPKLKEVAPDAVYMAVGYSYDGVANILADPNNWNKENEGDPAYTQAGRIEEWNEKVKTLVDEGYVTAITMHPYQSIGSHLNGLTNKNNMKIRSATTEMNYLSSLWDSNFYGDVDFYYTEWGQLEALIYWGMASSDPAEKIKYNYQKYPVAALYNLQSLLNYAKNKNVKMSHLHALCGTDGFGIVDDASQNRNYKIPNEIVFNHMSKVVVDTPVFYDIKPIDMTYVTTPRPAWNGFPNEILHIANVETWGFGDENGIKQVAFFNQTEVPQKVKIGGTTLKPTWAYGGDAEKLLPENFKNESYSAWAQTTISLKNSEAYTWLPETFDGAQFADEIEIPPYTILFADVNGTPQTVASSFDKVSDFASYAMRNSIILGVGKANAYVDNIEKQIDANISVTPIVENGRTLLPLRFVAESLGCDVEYNDVTQEIKVKDEHTEIHLKLGDVAYTVNGEEKVFDVPAAVRDGRTLLPLRALAESLGKDVYWDDRGYIIVGSKSFYIDNDINYFFDEITKLYQ